METNFIICRKKYNSRQKNYLLLFLEIVLLITEKALIVTCKGQLIPEQTCGVLNFQFR